MDGIKITFELGESKVHIECDPAWLSEQIAVLSDKLPGIFKKGMPPQPEAKKEEPAKAKAVIKKGQTETLMEFLKRKEVLDNNNKKFLAVAMWLTAGGKKKLTVQDINKAIKDNNVPGIRYPGNCRYQLRYRGFLKKDGIHFTLTPKCHEWI